MTTQIILVPGFWLDASAWDAVSSDLTGRGFSVSAVTLPGEEGASLADHAEAIRAEVDEAADRLVLVVHSGASFAGAVFVDRYPNLVDHVVFVDTAPPMSGVAFNPEHEGEYTLDDAWAMLEEEGSFRDLTEEQRAHFREIAVPVPASIVREEIHLESDDGHGVPATAICTAFTAEQYQQYADTGIPYIAALNLWNVTLRDLPTGHWPMWTRPAELAEIIAEVAQTPA